MSEDSIASDSISCRTEAPLLPPRKRLLAGLKQNGWSSPSSSSCAAAPLENLPVTETLAHTSMSKHEELDQNSVDAADRGSLQSLNCAAESVDSRQRKSKRHRASSLLTMKKSSKKKKKAGSEIETVKDFGAKVSSVPDGVKASDATPFSAAEKMKDDEDEDAVARKVSYEEEKYAIDLAEREGNVDKKEGEGDLGGHVTALKPESNPSSVVKEEEEVTCDEAHKPSRNPGKKANKGETIGTTLDEALKPRRNPNRQHQSRCKDAEQKKQEVQHDKCSQTHLPPDDEELARQLHRAMNSSPRIARCLSHKEERPLLSSSRKRYPGS